MELLSLLVVCLGAAAQGITGMGFGLICAPFLIRAYGPVEGVQQVVLLSLMLNMVFLLGEFRAVRVRDTLGLLLPALIVVPVIAFVLRGVDSRLLLVVAGVLTISSAAVLWSGLRWPALKGPAGALGAGALSAAMNVAGGLAGPAAALYAVNASWPAASVRSTLQAYGCGLNAVTLLSLGLPVLHGSLLLGLGAGMLFGLVVAQRLPQAGVRQLVLALAALGGVLAVLSGFS